MTKPKSYFLRLGVSKRALWAFWAFWAFRAVFDVTTGLFLPVLNLQGFILFFMVQLGKPNTRNKLLSFLEY